jgi:hypothetical protein
MVHVLLLLLLPCQLVAELAGVSVEQTFVEGSIGLSLYIDTVPAMSKENRQPLHMVGKEFRYQVRVKRCVAGTQAAKDGRITPGMVLIAINGTRIDRKLLRVQDKRGFGIASLKRVTAMLAFKPVTLLLMDCVLLREQYMRGPGSSLRHDRDESWIRQSVYSFCAAHDCSFWEYDELLKMANIDATQMQLQHQLSELDARFSTEATSFSSNDAKGGSITGQSSSVKKPQTHTSA